MLFENNRVSYRHRKLAPNKTAMEEIGARISRAERISIFRILLNFTCTRSRWREPLAARRGELPTLIISYALCEVHREPAIIKAQAERVITFRCQSIRAVKYGYYAGN